MIYTDKVIKHFKHPKNQGVIKDADAVGEKGNPACGDVMKIYLKVKSDGGKDAEKKFIKDFKFETLGCAAAIAVSSSLTERVKGMSLDEAEKVSKDDIIKDLGGLPPAKIHCSMLGVEALHEAIAKIKEKSKKEKKLKLKIKNII